MPPKRGTKCRQIRYPGPSIQLSTKPGQVLYGKYAELSTFYANSDDRALTLSWTVNREAPAGLAGASLLVIDGIETIDVSKADSNWLDVINHSVAFEAPIIAGDVERLLRAREKASVRGLPVAMHRGKPYWLIVK